MAGDETVVLLVDDEPALARTLARLLEMKGFVVRVAVSTAVALTIADEEEGPIHVLLSDVLMPDMPGPRLAEKVLERRPDCRVLFMSGYTDEELSDSGLLDEGFPFIGKPFPIEELVSAIRVLLE